MITLEYLGKSVILRPNKFEKYPKAYGSAVTVNGDKGYIEDKWEHEQGSVFMYFLMAWEFATEDEANGLLEFYKAKPTTKNPMTLTWEDGSRYYVVFADIEEAFKFDESVKDALAGTRYYKGTAVLIEITPE